MNNRILKSPVSAVMVGTGSMFGGARAVLKNASKSSEIPALHEHDG